MSTYGTNPYVAARIARYRADDLIRDARAARTAREIRGAGQEPRQPRRRGVSTEPRRHRVGWAIRRIFA